MRLKDKVAIITGAGDGFAAAIAAGYAKEGAKLYLQEFEDRADKLENTVADVRKQGAAVASGVHDITRAEPIKALVKAVLARYGQIDILVNTTEGGWHGVLFSATEDNWNRAIDRGLKAYYFMCQQVGKEMARRGQGKIINLTSIVGRIGAGGAVIWGAARGGVDAMTAALAQDLGQYGIHCVGLARGATEGTNYSPAARAERLRRLPFGRLGRAEDVVGPAIFLAGPESEWVTGSVLYCDGGYVTAAATDDEFRPKEKPYRGP